MRGGGGFSEKKIKAPFFPRQGNYIDIFIFTGNEDMYKSLNEIEIRPDATTGFHGNHTVIMTKMLCPL